MNRLAFLLALPACVGALPAQKLALADGSDRQVVVLDMAELLPEGRGLLAHVPPAERAAAVARSLQQLAAFVRATVPELAATGVDVQTLGERHVVVLGQANQVAAAEQWLVRAREHVTSQFMINVRWCVLPAATFAQHVAPRLPAADGEGPRTAVLDPATTTAMLRDVRRDTKALITQFPIIAAPALSQAVLKVGKPIVYVRDHELENGADGLVARPITETVFAGHEVNAMAASAANGRVALQLSLVDHVVEQPVPEVVTTIPGSTMEVRVQVPRITGCRATQVVEIDDGATSVVAARQDDGSWLVLLTTPQEIREGPRPPQRR